MTTEEMRKAISEVYSGPAWHWKVKNMEDDQVIAIYLKFEREGRFYRAPVSCHPKTTPKQLSIFDII